MHSKQYSHLWATTITARVPSHWNLMQKNDYKGKRNVTMLYQILKNILPCALLLESNVLNLFL